ncbi:MAG TPA: Gfo/Idh/MocA family oxidoreductase, partial [Chitinophagaceae bacterium]|nr:Gfo/Idh/MocA family oxidoreductase [Chitinophagaceae bacterium]
MNNNKKSNADSRRRFIRNAGLAAAGFYIVPRHVLGGKGFIAPSDKLLIAGIGAGGKGGDDQRQFAKTGKAEIAFLCDVDDRQAAENRKLFPKAKYYHDWRELFEKEHKHFDAVDVGIPDHNHAVVGFHAMQLGKHVYVQKPLTHDIWEARMMVEAEKRYKVVCQMGNQGSSSDGLRRLREWYDAGVIGEVHTVYCWTDRPTWPQAKPWLQKNPPVPKGLQWDLWLGTAMQKEYEDGVLPFKWRGWWDYGTGSLGDMGCHIMGTVFKVLGLEYPFEVAATACTPYVSDWEEGYYPDSPPLSSYI